VSIELNPDDPLAEEALIIDADLAELRARLLRLHQALRASTLRTYQRANPFSEDLFDWKEKGAALGFSDVTLYDSTTLIGDVHVGDHTWVGPFCLLDGSGGLKIGKFCSVASGCQLLSHDTVRWALSGGAEDYEYAPTIVGDCCFLGSFSVVLKGISIGNRSVVGAGSVVTVDVPANTIVAGVPARPIGSVSVSDEGAINLVYSNASSD
jgi:acetyltransferase-like isoleucine patch superfamily enzyme